MTGCQWNTQIIRKYSQKLGISPVFQDDHKMILNLGIRRGCAIIFTPSITLPQVKEPLVINGMKAACSSEPVWNFLRTQ
jgi:hypothetical protein